MRRGQRCGHILESREADIARWKKLKPMCPGGTPGKSPLTHRAPERLGCQRRQRRGARREAGRGCALSGEPRHSLPYMDRAPNTAWPLSPLQTCLSSGRKPRRPWTCRPQGAARNAHACQGSEAVSGETPSLSPAWLPDAWQGSRPKPPGSMVTGPSPQSPRGVPDVSV